MPSASFQLVALPVAIFQPLFARDAATLAQRHIQRIHADGAGHPPGVAYLHIHFARRGCYACRVERVE